MPNQQDCFFLGYITRPFGLKGELAVSLDVDEPERYHPLESVLIQVKGSLVPYFIEKVSPRGKTAVWKLEGVLYEEALNLVGSELYLPLSQLPPLSGKQFYFHEVLGFMVEDEVFGPLGVLERIYDQGPQAVLSINHDGKEVMIPLIDEFLVQVDREAKRIKVHAPEGLIDFYL